MVIGGTIGLIVFFGWSRTFGAIILGISLFFVVLDQAFPAASASVQGFLRRFGEIVATAFTYAILIPWFFLGMTAARVLSRIRGSDPLGLRASDPPTFWQPADADSRKRRYIRSMFATDPPANRATNPWISLLGLFFAGLLCAEIALRFWGLGTPVLYMNDPQCGFMPVPYQDVRRYDGRVAINAFGMRSADYDREKPEKTLRLFMIGDSTLYGGSYVDQTQLYSSLLEQKLRKELQTDVEVWAMGVNAWGPFHKTGYVEKYGAFDADLAIVCLPIGDIYRPPSQLTVGGAFFLATHSPKLALEELWGFAKLQLRWNLRAFLPGFKIQHEERSEEQGAKGIAEYARLVEQLRNQGCRVFVEVLPSLSAGTHEEAPELEAEEVQRLRAAIEPHADFSFPVGLFAGKGRAALIYRDECHLNDLGHQLYAEYLTKRLGPVCQQLLQGRVADPPR